MRKKMLITGVMVVLVCLGLKAQRVEVLVKEGNALPFFNLAEVKAFRKNTATNDDFKGKWLIMEFWGMTCSSCMKSFPKLNEVQRKYQEQVEVLLVGITTKRYNSDIRCVYDKIAFERHLSLPIAYDSTIRKSFGVVTVPHIIVVDPEGIVYAVTSMKEITMRSVRRLVRGKRPEFAEVEY